MLDIGAVVVIGIVFAGLAVGAYVIWTLDEQLTLNPLSTYSDSLNNTRGNVTAGFDDAVNLLLVAITIFILAIAIAALLLLRGRRM
jgi:hypothetical protein